MSEEEARVSVDTDGQQLPGQPLTVLLTSVDCSPCLKGPLLVEVPAVSVEVGAGAGAGVGGLEGVGSVGFLAVIPTVRDRRRRN